MVLLEDSGTDAELWLHRGSGSSLHFLGVSNYDCVVAAISLGGILGHALIENYFKGAFWCFSVYF